MRADTVPRLTNTAFCAMRLVPMLLANNPHDLQRFEPILCGSRIRRCLGPLDGQMNANPATAVTTQTEGPRLTRRTSSNYRTGYHDPTSDASSDAIGKRQGEQDKTMAR